MGRPVVVNEENNIFVHQPLIKDIVDLGEDKYNELILPYVMNTDAVFNGLENEDELKQQYQFFDLFFIKTESGTILDKIFGGSNALEVLQKSLRYFLRADEIRVLEKRQKVVINNAYMIDNNEFQKLRKAIQSVVNRKDIEVEKPPKNMTKRQRDIWIKLQKGRRRQAEKNAIYLQDIIIFCSLGGESFVPFDEIDNMTYYQLQNVHKGIMGKDAFNMGMGYKLSQKFDVKDDIKHWTETIKIGK